MVKKSKIPGNSVQLVFSLGPKLFRGGATFLNAISPNQFAFVKSVDLKKINLKKDTIFSVEFLI